MKNLENRAFSNPLEFRKDEESNTATISGYAAVFYDGSEGTQYEPWSGYAERIAPGAFDEALEGDDVRALFNHDNNLLLGRTSSGTLRLSVDKRGLKYEIDVNLDSPTGCDVYEAVKRGDVDGSSFGFVVTAVEWTQEQDGEVEVRTIKNLKLYDVSPVTFPAYKGTDSEARAIVKELRAEYDSSGKEEADAENRKAIKMQKVEIDARCVELGQSVNG